MTNERLHERPEIRFNVSIIGMAGQGKSSCHNSVLAAGFMVKKVRIHEEQSELDQECFMEKLGNNSDATIGLLESAEHLRKLMMHPAEHGELDQCFMMKIGTSSDLTASLIESVPEKKARIHFDEQGDEVQLCAFSLWMSIFMMCAFGISKDFMHIISILHPEKTEASNNSESAVQVRKSMKHQAKQEEIDQCFMQKIGDNLNVGYISLGLWSLMKNYNAACEDSVLDAGHAQEACLESTQPRLVY